MPPFKTQPSKKKVFKKNVIFINSSISTRKVAGNMYKTTSLDSFTLYMNIVGLHQSRNNYKP